MIGALVARLFILLFGTLYPAYASYKVVRTKTVNEYVRWLIYWITYAFFKCVEIFTDIALPWFPFYYELKVGVVIWLLPPLTKGSLILYREYVHPILRRHEEEIDEYLNIARERGYSAAIELGARGANYAANVIKQTAVKATKKLSNHASSKGSVLDRQMSDDDCAPSTSFYSTFTHSSEDDECSNDKRIKSNEEITDKTPGRRGRPCKVIVMSKSKFKSIESKKRRRRLRESSSQYTDCFGY